MSATIANQGHVDDISAQKQSNNACDGSKEGAPCVPWPIPPPNPKPEIKFNKLFINNEWMDSESGNTFSTVNPSTEEINAEVPLANKTDVDKAVIAAKNALKFSEWRYMDASDRGVLMNKLADKIDENKYYLACLESADSGKPYTHTFFMDTVGIAKILRYYAGWTDKIHGKTLPVDGDYISFTKTKPIGVCGLILPWNMPLVTLAMKLGPALCCGNTVIIKPSELTPLTALFVASLAKEAGFPAGVINVVTGMGEAGAVMSEHEDIDMISFTGTARVGKLIEQAAGRSNLKKLTLELSGNNPNIILADADVDNAVEQAHQGAFMNSGQMCTAGSRTFVHEDIYDEFVAKSVARAKKRVVAPPCELFCEQGPQINKDQLERVLDLIQSGINDGAKLECGGKRHGENGFYLQPTVFSEVQDHMKIATEEVFGPVQCIFKFKSIEEVIRRANDTPYGLAAGIFSNDINSAFDIASQLETGTVWINCFNAFATQTPFGGTKLSGKGREMGKEAINSFSEATTVTLKVPQIRKQLKKVREYSTANLEQLDNQPDDKSTNGI